MEELLETALLEQEKAVNRARCGGARGDRLELLDEHLKAASSSWTGEGGLKLTEEQWLGADETWLAPGESSVSTPKP
jgi:hypothetical protein